MKLVKSLFPQQETQKILPKTFLARKTKSGLEVKGTLRPDEGFGKKHRGET